MLSTLSLCRPRFGLSDEAPERIPRDSWLRLRTDAGVDDDEDANERAPDPPIDRVSTRPLASRSARESQCAMDGEGHPLECLPQALARPPSPTPAGVENGYGFRRAYAYA